MGNVSPQAITAFVATLALLGSIWSMTYLARQTKAAAEQNRLATEQTRIGNAMAAASANDMVLGALREVHLLILDRPGSRRYFYGGKPLPERGQERDEILTIAELLADVMSSGRVVHDQMPASDSAQPWEDYCRQTLQSSPVLRDLVNEHPTWWPRLPPLLPPKPPVSPDGGV